MFKLNRKTREYTVLVVILLLLVIAADVRGNYRIASSMVMAAIISYWITGNPLYSLYTAIIILFFFYLLSDTSLLREMERFENAYKLDDALEDVETKLKPKDEELGGEPEKDENAESALMKAVSSKPIPRVGDTDVPKVGDTTMQQYSTKIQTKDLATAQKETFQLIESIKQLKDVMESTAPVLKSGKKIMDMMRELNLTK